MGKSYSAYLIDSPPFKLDIEDLTAAWNRMHPDWQVTVPPLSRWANEGEVKYDFLGSDLTISENGYVFVYRGADLFAMFLEFYREYLPAEYKLCVSLGYFGEEGDMLIEKGFRAEEFEEPRQDPSFQVEIEPGRYGRKKSVIYWQDPMKGVQDYAFTVDYPLVERALREQLPNAALQSHESVPEVAMINFRTALARMDFIGQTFLIADSHPETTWELAQWYRALIPLDHQLSITVRSWQNSATKLARASGGVYSRMVLNEINQIPYPTRSSLPQEEFTAIVREVTRDFRRY